jgi:hypothetical protein
MLRVHPLPCRRINGRGKLKKFAGYSRGLFGSPSRRLTRHAGARIVAWKLPSKQALIRDSTAPRFKKKKEALINP